MAVRAVAIFRSGCPQVCEVCERATEDPVWITEDDQATPHIPFQQQIYGGKQAPQRSIFDEHSSVQEPYYPNIPLGGISAAASSVGTSLPLGASAGAFGAFGASPFGGINPQFPGGGTFAQSAHTDPAPEVKGLTLGLGNPQGSPLRQRRDVGGNMSYLPPLSIGQSQQGGDLSHTHITPGPGSIAASVATRGDQEKVHEQETRDFVSKIRVSFLVT